VTPARVLSRAKTPNLDYIVSPVAHVNRVLGGILRYLFPSDAQATYFNYSHPILILLVTKRFIYLVRNIRHNIPTSTSSYRPDTASEHQTNFSVVILLYTLP
jgi:hypothetical protein